MRTYRVDPKDYDGKKPLATGYKIFNWDWTGAGEYCYAADGEIEGSVHTVDGNLDPCEWGLHFCVNPLDCMTFKAPVQWMRFAKVSAFDEIKNADDGKTVARTLRIDKVLTWNEYIEACKTVQKDMLMEQNGATNSYDIRNGFGIRSGYGIRCGCGIRDSFGIIAQLWTVYTGHTVTAKDVAMMMALLKIARIMGNRATEDSFVDLAGYAACGAEIAGKGVKPSDGN